MQCQIVTVDDWMDGGSGVDSDGCLGSQPGGAHLWINCVFLRVFLGKVRTPSFSGKSSSTSKVPEKTWGTDFFGYRFVWQKTRFTSRTPSFFFGFSCFYRMVKHGKTWGCRKSLGTDVFGEERCLHVAPHILSREDFCIIGCRAAHFAWMPSSKDLCWRDRRPCGENRQSWKRKSLLKGLQRARN